MTVSLALSCLGLREDVSLRAAEKRFKRLVVKLHPDRLPNPTPLQQQHLLDVLEAIDVIRGAFDAGALPIRRAAVPRPEIQQDAEAYGDLRQPDLVVRATLDARCFRVFRRGVEILTLLRHPENAQLLYARDADGNVPAVFEGVQFWMEGRDGVIRPLQTAAAQAA